MDTMSCNVSYRQMYGTGFLDRFLDNWTHISAQSGFAPMPPYITFSNSAPASAPLIEYTRPYAPPRTIHDGIKLTSPEPSRWVNTDLQSPVQMSFYTIATGPFDYLSLMHMNPDAATVSVYDASRLNGFRREDYLPGVDYPPCDLRPG